MCVRLSAMGFRHTYSIWRQWTEKCRKCRPVPSVVQFLSGELHVYIDILCMTKHWDYQNRDVWVDGACVCLLIRR